MAAGRDLIGGDRSADGRDRSDWLNINLMAAGTELIGGSTNER